MRLLTTDQVAKETGAPYRQLLRWVEQGWFKPTATGGTDRIYHWFSEGDVWEIRWFEAIRDRFRKNEWPEVTKAIREIRQAEGALRFIAAFQPGDDDGGPLVCRAVGDPDFRDLVDGGAMVMLVTAPPVDASVGGQK